MTDLDNAIPVYALPPVPLTDAVLGELVSADTVEQVWVPTGRPASVTTRRGTHEGDILHFWLESDANYTRFVYGSSESGLRWYRFKPVAKTVPISDALADEFTGDDWAPVTARTEVDNG